MNKMRRTLSKRLSRTIMWLAIPIFVVALGIFYDHAHILIQEEAIERSSTILDNSVLRVESFIRTIETAAKSNLWMLETYFNPDSLQKTSRRIVQLNPDVLSCSVSTEPDVFPEYGRYFSVYTVNEGDTVITTIEPEFEYFDRIWYRTAIEKGKACWVEPFSDFNSGTINYHDAVASYCIPIRQGGGKIVGVVSADFSFKDLSEAVLETDHPYPNSYYMLIGADGRYLIHPETNLLFKKTIFSNNDAAVSPDIIALGHEMTEGKKGFMHVKLNDEVCHVCYAPVPGTNWSLALISPEDEIMADYRHLTRVMVVLVIIGLIAIRWLTAKVVRKNIQPVNQLLNATKEIANGNYEDVIPLAKGKDVISKLQNAFREMQLAIISHTKTIKKTTEEVDIEGSELDEILPKAQEAARRKQMFIKNISHQINSPLEVIKGLTSVLQTNLMHQKKDEGAHNTLQEEELHNITETMKLNAILLYRMMLMLSDSSDTTLADKERYHRNDVVSCNKVAQESIDYVMDAYTDTGIVLESELPDTFKIKTNHLYLVRTLRELLHNAAIHSDGKHVKMHISQTEHAVQFIVEDKGPGLPKDTQEHIYVPFMKGDDLTYGLGLGLPLCKGHATSLGGNLIYDESYHEGCRFILEMPKQ